MLKKSIVIVLSAILGAMFLLSAWFKLFPIEPFEYKIVGTTFVGWTASVFVARIIIGLELAIGILLLFSYKLKSNLKIAAVLLLVFSVHLLFQLLSGADSVDCGCMGSLLSLTPLEGLLKNLAMLVLIFLLYKLAFYFEFKWLHVTYTVFVFGLCFVFIVNPVDLNYSEKYLNKPFEGFTLNLDTLYSAGVNREKAEKPTRDIRGHKYILAFVSATCPHCKIAVQKLSVMNKQNNQIPFYLIINGDDEDIKKFLKKTESENIPHSKLNGDLFVELGGLHLPIIYYYNKGYIEKQLDYYTLEQDHIEKWLKK